MSVIPRIDLAQRIFDANGDLGAVGPPIKRDLRIGTEEDVVEYYQDDSANDEAEYQVPLSTRDSIKTLVTPAFPSWTTEQLEEYQTFYEELDLDAAESDAEYVPMTWTVTSMSSPMASSKQENDRGRSDNRNEGRGAGEISNRRTDLRDIQCFNCDQYSHYSAQCPLRDT